MGMVKTPEEIEKIRVGGKLLAEVLQQVVKAVRPGVAVAELDALAEKLIRSGGAEPSFKGYCARFTDRPFPATLCVSVNEEVVHGPGNRDKHLDEGDIVGLDLGLRYLGFYTDHAVTVPVGKIDKLAAKLIKVTEESLAKGIKQVKPGNYIYQISKAVQKHVEAAGFAVVRDLVGHGVGYQVHEDPKIPNYVPRGGKGENVKIEEGMVLAIEPMVTAGSWEVRTLESDGWTVVTMDGSLSAHFEHTVVVTKNGCDIITKI